jgi:hypothetical protein
MKKLEEFFFHLWEATPALIEPHRLPPWACARHRVGDGRRKKAEDAFGL